jgi:redox-sensitive bicupin YhaK (pirin superfamily)
MIQIFPENSRFAVDRGWLRSRPSFSFGEYQDPGNSSFGVMRVCNDDYIAAGHGLGAHPHSDMEIVTIVLEGQIRHEDSLGNVEITSFGEVQRMTAGTGIVHAEYNASSTEELTLLQLWFMPRERGLAPSYETSKYNQESMVNKLLPIVSHRSSKQVALIQQDMTIYLSKLEKGKQLSFNQNEGRRIYLFVIEGELTANEAALGQKDTARIESVSDLTLVAREPSFFMLIDLP